MPPKTIQLSFCEINIINNFIIEVIPQFGIEIGESELNEYHAFYNQLERPVGVLVNRENSYSYSLPALENITKHKNIDAVAILLSSSKQVYEANCITLFAEVNTDIKVFFDRQMALNWLNEHR